MNRIDVVYNGGPHPDRDLGKFRDACLKRFPNATEIDIGVLYRKAILQYDTPWRDRVVCLLGEDIMTEDIENHHLWPYMGKQVQNRIRKYPHVGGAVIEGESISERASSRMALLQPSADQVVNRSVLVSPKGMKESYVFSRRTQWSQEVREDDWALICQHPQIRKRFQVFETAGPLIVYRAYSQSHVVERHEAKTRDDVRHMVNEQSSRKAFQGLDIPEAEEVVRQ